MPLALTILGLGGLALRRFHPYLAPVSLKTELVALRVLHDNPVLATLLVCAYFPGADPAESLGLSIGALATRFNWNA